MTINEIKARLANENQVIDNGFCYWIEEGELRRHDVLFGQMFEYEVVEE